MREGDDKLSLEELAEKYKGWWADKPESYWFARLVQEVGELGSSLVGDHKDPPELELRQIYSIVTNWIRRRERNEFVRPND